MLCTLASSNSRFVLIRAGKNKNKMTQAHTQRSLSLVEDCDCRESGLSAVQSEAGGPGLRPIHCALIKYNRFNPHNSTVCYQKQLQAWCVPTSPRWLHWTPRRVTLMDRHKYWLTHRLWKHCSVEIAFCFFSVEQLFISRATAKTRTLAGLTVDDLNWEKAAHEPLHDFYEQKVIYKNRRRRKHTKAKTRLLEGVRWKL